MMRCFGTRSSTRCTAASSEPLSAATRHRKAIVMVVLRLSITWTGNPSTDWAPTRAASTVPENCLPMWMEITPSHSFDSRS